MPELSMLDALTETSAVDLVSELAADSASHLLSTTFITHQDGTSLLSRLTHRESGQLVYTTRLAVDDRNQLSEVAALKLVTAPPFCEYRVSGSRPRLPMRMTLLMPRPAMCLVSCLRFTDSYGAVVYSQNSKPSREADLSGRAKGVLLPLAAG